MSINMNDENSSFWISWDYLVEHAIKDVPDSDFSETGDYLEAVLDAGYTPEQINCAWDSYVERYWLTNDKPRFAKKIKNWLSDTDGFALDIQLVREGE